MKKTTYLSYIRGTIQPPAQETGEWVVRSPSASDEVLGRCVYSYAQIDEAIGAAREGLKAWQEKSIQQRTTILDQAFQNVFEKKESLYEVLRNELGRTDVDLDLEFQQIRKWWMGVKGLFEAQDFTQGKRESRGVTALIGSYVWPIFYSSQPIFMNLMVGNSVVVKPSERATLSVLKLAEILCQQSELSRVLHVLVGEKEVGRRLACHEGVKTVAFTGSFENGMRIKQDTLSQPAKEILLYLSSKNPIVICEDFQFEGMKKVIQDTFLSTGQHCRSASIVFVHDRLFSEFLKEFHESAKAIRIGKSQGKLPSAGMTMGPMIDQAMLDRYLKFVGISEREGAEVQMRGKPFSTPEKGNFITPTVVTFDSLTADQMKKSVSLQTEILSPHVSLVRYDDDEGLIEVLSQMQSGLCAGVWGENRERCNRLADSIDVGQVLINQSLLEWNPQSSFQARKKSGNHAYHGNDLFRQITALKSILE